MMNNTVLLHCEPKIYVKITMKILLVLMSESFEDLENDSIGFKQNR